MMLGKIEGSLIAAPSSALSIPTSAPLGISGDSSLSIAPPPAEGVWAAITRPFHPTPEPNYMLALLEVERQMTRTLKKEGKNLELDIKNDLQRLEEFNRQKIEMLKMHAEELKSKAEYGAWKTIAEYVAYSSSIAFGAACFASGAGVAPALFLISSGVIGIVNRIGTDSGAWRWAASYITESQQKQIHIAQSFENAMTNAAIALSLAGACSAYHAQALERMLEVSLGLTALNIAGSGMQVAQKMGEAYHDRRRIQIESELKLFNEKTLDLQTEISMNTAEIQKMFKLSEEIDKVVKSAIASRTLG